MPGSTYIGLPDELKHSKKELITIKNGDNKCFVWCYIRHVNPFKKNLQRTTKLDQTVANNFYSGKNVVNRFNEAFLTNRIIAKR